jgi:hypothetical protein
VDVAAAGLVLAAGAVSSESVMCRRHTSVMPMVLAQYLQHAIGMHSKQRARLQYLYHDWLCW